MACLPSVTAPLLSSVISDFRRDLALVGLKNHDEPQENVAEKILNDTVDLGILVLDSNIRTELEVDKVAWDRLGTITPLQLRRMSQLAITAEPAFRQKINDFGSKQSSVVSVRRHS